jgi:hypothetical protein
MAHIGNQNALKHGHAPKLRNKSGTYNAWIDMRRRCNNPGHPAYSWYGARGIKVCYEWDKDFTAFVRDMGEKPYGCSLDRINNEGHYEPGNCRWATRIQQATNRRSSRFLDFNGERKTISQWARDLGMLSSTLQERLRAGWDISIALTKPVQRKHARE